MTQTEARQWIEAEIDRLERAPSLNGCSMTEEWQQQLDVFRLCKAALDGSAIDAKYVAAFQNGYKAALESSDVERRSRRANRDGFEEAMRITRHSVEAWKDMLLKAQTEIAELETKCHQLQKERDALVEDMKMINDIDGVCRACKHYESFLHNSKCWKDCGYGNESKFEWRGVQE